MDVVEQCKQQFWVEKVGSSDSDDAVNNYAHKLQEEVIKEDMILTFDEDRLKELGIKKMGHHIAFLNYVKRNGEAAVSGESTVIKNDNQLRNLMMEVKHLEKDLEQQRDDVNLLRRKILRLNRKMSLLKLGEIATLLLQCFNFEPKKYKRFLKIHGYDL